MLNSDKISVVDSGSNSNGSYVQYSDGTMEEFLNVMTKVQSNSVAYGTVFSSRYDWTFPKEFISVTYVKANMAKIETGASWGALSGYNNSLAIFSIIDGAARTAGQNLQVNLYARGKWK